MDSQKKAEQQIRKMATGLLAWYDFMPGTKVLFVGDDSHALLDMLRERQLGVLQCCLEDLNNAVWCDSYKGNFDYVIAVKELEKTTQPVDVLKVLSSLLNDSGRLLLGMNNRLGVRYFCGDRDCYTDHIFDGLEGYRGVCQKPEDEFDGRMYSHYELASIVAEAGFTKNQFFSVWPDLSVPSHLFEEHVAPSEDMSTRLFPFYYHPETVFLEERPSPAVV